MSKSGDSDAPGALKRVTGVTVIGGKFVYVRGLGERYLSTLLNGSSLPSLTQNDASFLSTCSPQTSGKRSHR